MFFNANHSVFVFRNLQNNMFNNVSSLQFTQETTQTPIVMRVPEGAQPAYTSENTLSMPEESNIEERQTYNLHPSHISMRDFSSHLFAASGTEVAYVTLSFSLVVVRSMT